jgi:hypothetical protein
MPDRSKGDSSVFLEILDSWPRLGKVVLLACSIAAILLLLAYFIVTHLPSNTSELQIGSSHILFQQPTKDGVHSVLMVCPQGWNRTAIHVLEGQILHIEAGGKVNIDLAGLNRAIEARRNAEERVAKTVGETATPEDYYTDQEKQAIMSAWPWTGPDGVPEAEMASRANPKRTVRSILPKEGYGVLIGAFGDIDAEPADHPNLAKQLASAAFRVGSWYEKKATGQASGYLYFTVNDVQYSPVPELFFVDNIGAYYVKVQVSK